MGDIFTGEEWVSQHYLFNNQKLNKKTSFFQKKLRTKIET